MTPALVRVLICDDQQVVCEGLQAILSTVPGIDVVGIANDGEQALALAAKVHPHLVLMDLKMPVLNGIQATIQMVREFPEIRVLALTTYDDNEWVFDAIRAGVHGYLLKNTPREGLVAAIREVVGGKSPVDPAVARKLFSHLQGSAGQMDSALLPALSVREMSVLKLLGKGLNNAAIAEHLHLTEGTVKNLVSSILSKLQVDDRTQAALLAVRSGIVED